MILYISSAVVTSMRRMLGSDNSKLTGPATSVTSAPSLEAAFAKANPVFPDERFVRNRTGSIASRVGPAEINTFFPLHNFSWDRSEEHTSELQSRFDLVCRLLLEKKKQKTKVRTK